MGFDDRSRSERITTVKAGELTLEHLWLSVGAHGMALGNLSCSYFGLLLRFRRYNVDQLELMLGPAENPVFVLINDDTLVYLLDAPEPRHSSIINFGYFGSGEEARHVPADRGGFV